MNEVIKPIIESEEVALIRLCTYIKLQYPNIIFTSEQSGLFVTKGQAVKMSKTRSSRALPDLWILEPRKGYYAMLIELKREGTVIYKRNGDLIRDKHIAEQEEMRNRLRNKGYFCEFAIGYDEAKNLVDYYLTDKH